MASGRESLAPRRVIALAQRTVAPEDALEPALRAVMEAGGASAGAVCLFDPDAEVLRLVAEVGLSDEGCRQLRKVTLGGDGAWTAPLESLMRRRTCVLDRAAGATVPPLVEGPESIRAVACLPLYAAGKPCASVILVALTPAVIDPDVMRDIEAALVGVARIVKAIGRPSRRKAPLLTLHRDDVVGEAVIVEPPPLPTRASVPSSGGEADPLADAGLAALLAERDELIVAREVAERAHLATVSHLTARLGDLEREWAREHSLRVEQEHRFEHDRTRREAEREATVGRAVRLAEEAETRRAAAAAETESVRAELAAVQRRTLEANEQLRRARAEVAAAVGGAAQAERARLSRALDEMRARDREAATRIGQLDADISALRAREAGARAHEAEATAHWETRLAAAARALDEERERVLALDGARQRIAAQLDDALAAERRTREELAALAERTADDRDEVLRQALEIQQRAEEARAAAVAELEAVRGALGEAQKVILDAEDRAGSLDEAMLRTAAEASQKAEAARAAAVADLEAARAALALAQADALTARSEAHRSRGRIERLSAERDTAVADAQRLASAWHEAETTLAASAARIAQLEEEERSLLGRATAAQAGQAQGEARWGARLTELETSCARERIRAEELEREVARQARALADAQAREQQSRAMLAAVTEDRDGVLSQTTELARRAEEARAAAAAEAEAIRGALASAQSLILQAEDEARHARADLERHEAELRASEADRKHLAATLEEARSRVAALEQQQSHPLPHAGSVAVRGAAAVETGRALPPDGGIVAVVDASGAFAACAGAGAQVEVLSGGPDLAMQVAALRAARVLVNLAGAGGLEAIATLRAAGYQGHLWGCLAAPGVNTALSLGMIESTGRPLDPDAVLGMLAGHAIRNTRILAIGATSNSLISLRQALARQGMSMSIAWDAKQAADLVTMVRPQVVIVDLALPPRGGHGVVADLAAVEWCPTVVLVPSEGDDAAAFAAAFAARARHTCALPHRGLVQAVSRAAAQPPMTSPGSTRHRA